MRARPSARRPILACLAALLAIAVARQAPGAEFTQLELAYMPASTQLELFRRGVISPVDVLEAQIAQIEKTNGEVNAITTAYFEAARKMAAASARRYREGGARPLEGITVGVKDEHHDAGWVVTMGSLVHKDDSPKGEADPIVAKLKDAGAIPVFHTTVPELYLNFVTSTRAWGTTRNPWNLEFAVGGSSGGSGAALASGYCTIATGSDMGGSIRIPCAFNGLYGLKPAFGTVHAPESFSHFSGTGPMARTFEDMVLMYNAISGPAPESVHVAPQPDHPLTYESIEGMRIAYIGGMGVTEPSEDVSRVVREALKGLRRQGATVDVIRFDFGVTPDEMSAQFQNMALAGAMGGMFAGYADEVERMTGYGRYFVEKSAAGGYGNVQLMEAEAFTKRLHDALQDQVFSNGYDAVIAPTMPTSHVPADWDLSVPGAEIVDGRRRFHRMAGGLYTLPFNFMNWRPVVSVPAGLSPRRMPIGMQIVGKPHDTETVLRIAFAYSRAAPPMFVGERVPRVR